MFNGSGWGHPIGIAAIARAQGLLAPERAAPARWSGRLGARRAAASAAARRFVQRALNVVFASAAARPIGAARPRQDGAG